MFFESGIMIICIAGFSGCGKTSVGDIVAKRLGLRAIKLSFKDEAAKTGMKLMEYQELASNDRKYDEELDKAILLEAGKGNCVIMTWLGPWKIRNADLRVWLSAGVEERARRISDRDKLSFEDAVSHVKKRDANNVERYRNYYGIDITDHSIFDLDITTEKFGKEQVAEIIVRAAEFLG